MRALFLLLLFVMILFPSVFVGKICLKGNKNHNLRCPLKQIRVSSGCGRRGDSLPLPAGRFGGWVGDSSSQGGYLGWEGLQALRRAPLSLWVSLGLEPWAPSRNSLEPSGAPNLPWFVGSRPGIFSCTRFGWSGVEELWSCRNWAWTGAAASDLLLLGGSRDGGWSFLTQCCF